LFQGKLQYEVRGVAPGSDFFYIEKNSGKLKVLKPLNIATAVTYKVSVTSRHHSHRHTVTRTLLCERLTGAVVVKLCERRWYHGISRQPDSGIQTEVLPVRNLIH